MRALVLFLVLLLSALLTPRSGEHGSGNWFLGLGPALLEGQQPTMQSRGLCYWRVMADNTQLSQHTTQHVALNAMVAAFLARPSQAIWTYHDCVIDLRVGPVPQPPVEPPVDPPVEPPLPPVEPPVDPARPPWMSRDGTYDGEMLEHTFPTGLTITREWCEAPAWQSDEGARGEPLREWVQPTVCPELREWAASLDALLDEEPHVPVGFEPTVDSGRPPYWPLSVLNFGDVETGWCYLVNYADGQLRIADGSVNLAWCGEWLDLLLVDVDQVPLTLVAMGDAEISRILQPWPPRPLRAGERPRVSVP